jgi:NodT family efflux transporter outer membrane factor (OMF) lipoprotein
MSFEATRALAATTLSLVLVGCSVAPPPAPEPPASPNQWSARALPVEDTIATVWWVSFRDPQLESLVIEALAANHELAAAAARVEAAAAEARIAGADRRPQIGAALDAARSKRNFIGFPIPGSSGSVLSTTTTTYSSGLSISWEADLWGRLRAGKAAAAAGLAAAEADLAAARLSLGGQTAKAWFGLVEAGLQTQLAESTLDNRRSTREQIERRYAAGIRGPLDLRLARSSEAAAEALLAQRRRQHDGAARRLDLLLSRYPAGRLADNKAILPPAPPPAPAGLPSELVTRRPDLRAAEHRLAAAGFRVAQARAALYPALRLTGSAGSLSDEVEELLDSDFSVWGLAGNLLQPILQGGRLRAGVELGEARHREAANLYAQSVLRAFSEVETALTAERLLGEQATALDRAAADAAAGERLAGDRYRRGVGDYLAVLASQAQALEAASQQLAAHRALLDTRVDLHLALGGDFTTPTPTTVPDPRILAAEPMP